MTEAQHNEPGLTFWFVAGFFLVFNLSGLMVYYMQVTVNPEIIMQNYAAAEQTFILGTPKWATAAFALAVNSGILASVLLLLRKGWAMPIFVFSLVCVLLQNVDSFLLRNALDVWGTSALRIPAVIIVICIIEIWYSLHVRAKGWLR